jgi:predicted nucleic acid-binding protein
MLLDSNIIIIASKLTHIQLISYLRTKETSLKVSILSQIEVLGYDQLRQVEKLFLEKFFDAIEVLPINEKIAQKAIQIRQRKPIALADTIIAATALHYDLPLLTENVKDYTGIKGLKIFSVKDVVEN